MAYSYDFCPLPDPDVGLSILVGICDGEHTSFHVRLCGRKFVQVYAPYVIAGSTQESPRRSCTSFSSGRWQGCFEDNPVFGTCRPACHDSSLYLFVQVNFLEAVVVSQVYVASALSISTLFTFVAIIFVFAMFIVRPIRLLSSDSSCSVCCSYCVVSVHKNMSSAKWELVRNYPSISTPLFSYSLTMLSSVAVNSMGEMVSPSLTPLLILIF